MTDLSGVARNPHLKGNSMRDFLISIRTNAWRTSRARYNAARRLKRREFFATVSLAFFSAATAALAFMQKVYAAPSGTPLDNYLTALSACLGIFLLAISLMEWGSANGAKADAMHRNAEDLNALQLKISMSIAKLDESVSMTWDDVDALRREYESVKERCSYNHAPIDDEFFRATHRKAKEFQQVDGAPQIGLVEGSWIALKYLCSSIWYFLIFWGVLIALLSYTPW